MKELIKKEVFHFTGISCGKCREILTKYLSPVKGIRSIVVKKDGEAYVEYNLLQVSFDAIAEALERGGLTLTEGM